MRPITEQDVIRINKKLINVFSPKEMLGVKCPDSLSSAVNRPLQTMFGQYLYPEIFDKAVALLESLAKNHPFHNGNKRTAFGAMTYFLYINDHICYMNDEDAADLVVEFVIGKLSFESVVQIIKGKTYRKSSWRIWLDQDRSEVERLARKHDKLDRPMIVHETSEVDYTVTKNSNKTKEEVKNQVFANAIPFDNEVFQIIIDMYYGAFEDLVNR